MKSKREIPGKDRELMFRLLVRRIFGFACLKIEFEKYFSDTVVINLISRFFIRLPDNIVTFYVDTDDIQKCRNVDEMYLLLMKHCFAELLCNGYRDSMVFCDETWNEFKIGENSEKLGESYAEDEKELEKIM